MEALPMKAIELIGDIDAQHRLRAAVPEELPVGPVRLIVLLSEEDASGVRSKTLILSRDARSSV